MPDHFKKNIKQITAAPLNFVPVENTGSGGLLPLMPQQQHQHNFPFLHENNGHFRPGVAASVPGCFGYNSNNPLPPVVACSPGSELSTAFTLACDIFDEIDERTAAAAAAAAAGVSHFGAFGRSPSTAAAAARPPTIAPPSLAGIQEEANVAASAAAAAAIAANNEDGNEKLRGLDFDDEGGFDDGGGDDDEMLLAALEGVPRPIVNAPHHHHHNPYAASSYTPGSAGPLADSYGSTGDELAGFGAAAGGRTGNGNESRHHHNEGPSSLASSSYGGLGASGTHFAALSPSVAAHHHNQAAAAALRSVQSAAAMGATNGGGAFSFGANGTPNGGGGFGSSLAAAAAENNAARPSSSTGGGGGGGYAALAAAGGLGGIASSATSSGGGGGGRMLSSSAPRSGARGPRHGMGFGGGALGGRNPLSVSSSLSLKALSSSFGRGGGGSGGNNGNGDGSASSSFTENNTTTASRDGSTPSHFAEPSRSGRVPRPPRRPLDGYSDDDGTGGAGSGRYGERGLPGYGSFAGAGRKVHSPWSVEETGALVRGVETCGGGRWADIKKLGLPELKGRSAVDLKDKWRNLARLVALPSATQRSVAVPAAAGSGPLGPDGAAGGTERRKLPAELLERVGLLLPTSPAMPYGRITPSRVPGARARKRR